MSEPVAEYSYTCSENLRCQLPFVPSEFDRCVLEREDDLAGILASISMVIRRRLTGGHFVTWVNVLRAEEARLMFSILPSPRKDGFLATYVPADDDGDEWH